VTAINRADFDRVFDELIVPELRIENRSRSAFPDRSAAELRASVEELDAASDLRASLEVLNAMVASARTWLSSVCWVSPAWSVARLERDAVGEDGEQYAWAELIVFEIRDGRFASMCEFDLEAEGAAFAYAE
jgi:hypothetical protein